MVIFKKSVLTSVDVKPDEYDGNKTDDNLLALQN